MLKQGSVIRARVGDPQGGNTKVRPLVIVTPTNEIAGENPIAGVAVTGLRKPCVAKCSWLVVLGVADVVEQKGFVSTERLTEILTKIRSLESKETNQSE
jgi:hypothetical protein